MFLFTTEAKSRVLLAGYENTQSLALRIDEWLFEE